MLDERDTGDCTTMTICKLKLPSINMDEFLHISFSRRFPSIMASSQVQSTLPVPRDGEPESSPQSSIPTAVTTPTKKYEKWSNIDLKPTPPEERNWSPLYYFSFQFSIAFSPTTYNIGSTLFSIGLNFWTIILAAFVGTGLCCLVLFLNSRGPVFYHIG